MRTNHRPARPHAIQDSAKILKRDFTAAGSRLIDDSKDLASAGKGEFDKFVKSTLFLTGAAAFFVGGFFGLLMRRR